MDNRFCNVVFGSKSNGYNASSMVPFLLQFTYAVLMCVKHSIFLHPFAMANNRKLPNTFKFNASTNGSVKFTVAAEWMITFTCSWIK